MPDAEVGGPTTFREDLQLFELAGPSDLQLFRPKVERWLVYISKVNKVLLMLPKTIFAFMNIEITS